MAILTKKRKAAVAKFDGTKTYNLQEAAQIIKQVSTTKFDATVDIAVRLGVGQNRVSNIERGDLERVQIDTLRRYVEAVGGVLRVEVEIGDDRFQVA